MAAVQQINRGSQQQAAATHQTSAALAQIELSAKLAQTKASEANTQLKNMEAATLETRTRVEQLISSVSTAAKETRTSLATIRSLENIGRKIEKIVEAIALISVQTNMLAVSGAVEAARAGETGRGFAVVSNDIRVLSRESSNNVERAKDTVRGVLDQISVLKRDMEQIIAASDLEVQNNRDIVASLKKLDGDLNSLSAANKAILDGAYDILAGATETAAAARQIASAAEESSKASEQAASASTQQARGAEDLAAAIEEIASLADELKKESA
jgi:methyl-accepting chemotaxis protein